MELIELTRRIRNHLVVFHQPLWKICGRQNGFTCPNFEGWTFKKYLKPPPPSKLLEIIYYSPKWILSFMIQPSLHFFETHFDPNFHDPNFRGKYNIWNHHLCKTHFPLCSFKVSAPPVTSTPEFVCWSWPLLLLPRLSPLPQFGQRVKGWTFTPFKWSLYDTNLKHSKNYDPWRDPEKRELYHIYIYISYHIIL